MQARISHRHDLWDGVAEDYTARRLKKLDWLLETRGLRPVLVQVKIGEEGHGRTECSVRAALPRMVASAHCCAHSLLVALRTAFDQLEQQVERHSQRVAGRPKAAYRTRRRIRPTTWARSLEMDRQSA